MRTNRVICTAMCEYLPPRVEIAEVVVEEGFAASMEIVDKDDEIEF